MGSECCLRVYTCHSGAMLLSGDKRMELSLVVISVITCLLGKYESSGSDLLTQWMVITTQLQTRENLAYMSTSGHNLDHTSENYTVRSPKF
jgi:hypothetical protein